MVLLEILILLLITSLLIFRHTSGTKRSLSGISTEGSIPPSPLRKEFTSEPPTDIPKITSVGSENSSVNTTTTLSVSNLPHLLEKISDTGSTHDTDTSNSMCLAPYFCCLIGKTMSLVVVMCPLGSTYILVLVSTIAYTLFPETKLNL